MRAIILAMLFVSTSALATHDHDDQVWPWSGATPDEQKQDAAALQRLNDLRVGYCSAYHMIFGNPDAGVAVQRLAKDKAVMAEGGYGLALYAQRSSTNMQTARTMGQQACQALKFVYTVPKQKYQIK